jgi:hypothetical protein
MKVVKLSKAMLDQQLRKRKREVVDSNDADNEDSSSDEGDPLRTLLPSASKRRRKSAGPATLRRENAISSARDFIMHLAERLQAKITAAGNILRRTRAGEVHFNGSTAKGSDYEECLRTAVDKEGKASCGLTKFANGLLAAGVEPKSIPNYRVRTLMQSHQYKRQA